MGWRQHEPFVQLRAADSSSDANKLVFAVLTKHRLLSHSRPTWRVRTHALLRWLTLCFCPVTRVTDSLMNEIASRLNAVEQGVRVRDAGCNLNTRQSAIHARRGRSVAQPVWHREWHEDQEHEQHREMLARVKQFDGDVDKLLAECQQGIGIGSGQPGEFNQELKDCVYEPRRVSQRVPRQLRIWLRVQVCLWESLRVWIRVWIRVCSQVCRHAERKRCDMVLVNQLRLTNVIARGCVYKLSTTGLL